MAFKVFTNGSVLNASEINDNLMNQSVMVFSNAAARTAAITSPTEGMLTYLVDQNLFFVRDETNWRPTLATLGGILQVVHAATSTSVSNNTSTFADTTLTGVITPKSASSRIIMQFNQSGVTKDSSNTENQIQILLPNSGTLSMGNFGFTNSTLWQTGQVSGGTDYSSGGTSPLTFKTRFRSNNNTAGVSVQSGNAWSSMVLMEVAN